MSNLFVVMIALKGEDGANELDELKKLPRF